MDNRRGLLVSELHIEVTCPVRWKEDLVKRMADKVSDAFDDIETYARQRIGNVDIDLTVTVEE